MERLENIGEDLLIQSLIEHVPLKNNVLLGPGDDCAVMQQVGSGDFQLLKTDSIFEGTHFMKDAPPYWIGWKATARVVSDFAAMGGKPDALMVAIALPKQQTLTNIKLIYEGIFACARQFNFSIVGGETSSNEKIVLTLSGVGTCQKPILRSGAQDQDAIFVTGELGGSIKGKHLRFLPRMHEALWLSENFTITAMMDLSDGLGKDLPRLATASQLGYEIELDSIPITNGCNIQQAIDDGEDYELLFTCNANHTESMMAEWTKIFPSLKLSKIGKMSKKCDTPLTGGWDHFL
jgi:thiamine-monophosphate kinase